MYQPGGLVQSAFESGSGSETDVKGQGPVPAKVLLSNFLNGKVEIRKVRRALSMVFCRLNMGIC